MDRELSEHCSEPSNQLVLVLGMHRSGTSLLINLLNQAGYYVGKDGDLLPASEWNQKGYFERRSIALANDLILQHCGGNWDYPPTDLEIERINIDSTLEPLVAEYHEYPRSAIKDPRMCITLPVWTRVLGENIRIIINKRDEEAVAASLIARDGFSREKCRQLYEIYYDRAQRYAAEYPSFDLSYEVLFTDGRAAILSELRDFLGLEIDLESIATHVVDPTLRHHKPAAIL